MIANLGDEVTDKVTGFKGTVIGVTDFLNGCTRLGVQPKCGKDGKIPDPQWIDEPQLVVTKQARVAPAPVELPKSDDAAWRSSSKTTTTRAKGGPIPSVPQRQQGPRR